MPKVKAPSGLKKTVGKIKKALSRPAVKKTAGRKAPKAQTYQRQVGNLPRGGKKKTAFLG